MDKDYVFVDSSGYYMKIEDQSSPYIKRGANDYVLLADASGNGGSVDVLGTVIESFSNNTDVPKNGDTLQVTLDKFYTFDKTITTELGTVKAKVEGLPPTFTEAKVKNTKLTGLVVNNESPVVAADTLLAAIGKLQARSSAQEALIANQATTITGQAAAISDLTTRLEALEGA